MKRWPLRGKIAFYAAALGLAATLGGAGTTWLVIYYLEAVRAGADLVELERISREIILGMFAAVPTVFVIVFLGGKWLARHALAPMEKIRQAAERITAKSLDQRLPVPAANDEVAALVAVLNSTFERLERSFQQAVRFSAEASHHLKTPISVLRAGIEEILTDPKTPAKQQARANALLHQVHELTSIAENLLLLARADAGRLELQPTLFDLREVLDGICDDARALAEENGLTFETDVPPDLVLVADRSSIALIVQNLIENAVKYSLPSGRVRISAHGNDGQVEVRVSNNSQPIPPERAAHIFERFYRALPDGRNPGPGLGLSVAKELTKAHHGSLDLVRSDGELTEFRLQLPRTLTH